MKKLSEIPYKHSGDGADENDSEKPDWMYFDSLLFLKDQMIPRKSSGDFHEGEEESELTGRQEELIERHSVSEDESRSNTTTLSPQSTPLPSPSGPVPKKFKTKGRNADSIGEGMLKAEEKKVAYLKRKEEMRQAKELKEIDEDEAFFKCILPHVRSFSAKQKMSFRIQVLQLLNKERPGASSSESEQNSHLEPISLDYSTPSTSTSMMHQHNRMMTYSTLPETSHYIDSYQMMERSDNN